MKGSQARRLALEFALAALVAGLLVAFVALEGLWPEGRLANEPLHATVEALGGLIAVVMATFLLQRKREAYAGTFFLLALGFVGMGLLDLFHAATTPDKGFVLLHSVASLVGGFWFALTWFPELTAGGERPLKRWAPLGATVGALVFGVWTLVARDTLPAMTRDGTFTGTAVVINVLAGTFFMLGATRLLLDFQRTNKLEIYLLACMAGLFGLANLVFPFSTLWDNSWWMWHLLRLTAYVLALGFTLHQYRGTVLHLSTTLVEHEEAEGRLRDAEARYRRLFEQSPDGILIVDTQTGLPIEFNETAPRRLGYTREEFTRLRINDYEALEKPEETNARIEKVLREGRNDFETQHRSKTGELRNVLVTVQVIELSGRPVFHCIFRDITEHKRTKEALAIQQGISNIFLTVPDDEMFNEVLNVILDVMRSPFGVFGYLDETGALVVPTMTRQIWDKCQVTEKTIRFPRETWGDSSWPRAIRERKANYTNDLSTKAPEGHVAVTRHISLPILSQGEVIGLFQVANKETDYTEADLGTLEAIAGHVAPLLSARLQRERAQEALRQLNAELEQRVRERTAELEASNKELEGFSYSVSHDLRAPLRAIDGYGRILTEEYEGRLDPEGRRVLGVISSETRRMGQLIDDLLAFSRLGRQKLESSNINMTALAKAVFEGLAAQAPKRVLQLELKPLLETHGDGAMMHVVLGNLLSNAIKFTEPRNTAVIEIGSRQEDAQAVFYVKDNGVGFDMKYAHKLFGVFQRLHSTEEFEGTGVGLALVQRVIHRHAGRVWAEGKVNEGATFYFSLPNIKGTP